MTGCLIKEVAFESSRPCQSCGMRNKLSACGASERMHGSEFLMESIIVATCGGRSETIPCFKVKPVNVRGPYCCRDCRYGKQASYFSETSFQKDMKPPTLLKMG